MHSLPRDKRLPVPEAVIMFVLISNNLNLVFSCLNNVENLFMKSRISVEEYICTDILG